MTTKILTSQLDGFLSYICSGKFTIKFHDSKWQLDFTTKKMGWPEKHISVQVAKLEDLLFETWAAVRKLNVYSLGGSDRQEIERLMAYGYSQDFLELYTKLHPVVKESESYTCQCGAFVLKGPHVECILNEKNSKAELALDAILAIMGTVNETNREDAIRAVLLGLKTTREDVNAEHRRRHMLQADGYDRSYPGTGQDYRDNYQPLFKLDEKGNLHINHKAPRPLE